MRKKLGEILVETGAVNAADVDAALSQQGAGEPERLGDLLVASGKLSAKALAQALAGQYGLPYVELPALPQAVIDLVPMELQRQHRFVPLQQADTELTIALADLANLEVVATLEQTWTKVNVCVADGDEIDALHATLSGLFAPPPPPARAASLAEDLFGSIDDMEPPPVAPPMSPPAVSRTATSTQAEELFGALNLESARTGISVQPEVHPEPPPAAEAEDPVIDGEPAENSGVVSGVVVVPPPGESTAGLFAMLALGDQGAVVETPFKSDQEPLPVLAAPVPAGTVAYGMKSPLAPAPSVVPEPPAVFSMPSSPGDPMPDWLSGSTPSAITGAWTGALDHLAPSKLVVGTVRVLLARGLVTEAEILAALGEKS